MATWFPAGSKPKLFVSLVLLSIVVIYIKENMSPYIIHGKFIIPKQFVPCQTSISHLRNIVKYTGEVNTILDSQNITNFLLYGSLWGIYRFEGPLPWDYDSDIAIIDENNYVKSALVNSFTKAGFRVIDAWWSSSFRLRKNNTRVDIFVFKNYLGTMKRPGLEPSLAFLHYNVYHAFPAWMAESPLPTKRFGWLNVRVPRGGREVLQFLYPFSWRKQHFPEDCKIRNVTLEVLKRFITENVNNI